MSKDVKLQIYRGDKQNGEIEIFIERPGGAFNPVLSPDGSKLAYMARDDLDTIEGLVQLMGHTRREFAQG